MRYDASRSHDLTNRTLLSRSTSGLVSVLQRPFLKASSDNIRASVGL